MERRGSRRKAALGANQEWETDLAQGPTAGSTFLQQARVHPDLRRTHRRGERASVRRGLGGEGDGAPALVGDPPVQLVPSRLGYQSDARPHVRGALRSVRHRIRGAVQQGHRDVRRG